MTGNIHLAKIVVAEDTQLSRKLIQNVLEGEGFENIIFAKDGVEAIEIVEKEIPDLLMLDVNMPRLTGLEVCEIIRRDKKLSNLPILFQSVLGSADDRNQAFNAGATDYVTKPINGPELIARISMHLEKKLLITELCEFSKRVSEELSIARDTQRNLMPNDDAIYNINKKYSLNIKAYSKASSELGGDMWGLVPLNDNQLGFYILDVAGHGVSAALNTFRLHQVIDQNWTSGIGPDEIMMRVNNLVSSKMGESRFATMLCGMIDIENETLSYASAAQPSPIYISRLDEKKAQRCVSEGSFVGVKKKLVYDLHTIPFKKRDSFFTYSDALIETKDRDGKLLGENGLYEYVSSFLNDDKDENFFDPLIRHFNENYKPRLNDDLTLLKISNMAGG